MRALYYFRVFFVSLEFAFLVVFYAAYMVFNDDLNKYFPLESLNEDAVKWVMLLPVGLAGWTLKEGVGVIFPGDDVNRVLHQWPDYWRIKAHFDVGVLNAFLFFIPCLIVWMLGDFNTLIGATFFFAFAGSLSINAFSFYTAKLNVRTALLRLDD